MCGLQTKVKDNEGFIKYMIKWIWYLTQMIRYHNKLRKIKLIKQIIQQLS